MDLFQIIDKEINPNVEQWEKEGQFPAKKVFKTLGNAGLLGVTKPTGWHLIIYRNDIANQDKFWAIFKAFLCFFHSKANYLICYFHFIRIWRPRS